MFPKLNFILAKPPQFSCLDTFIVRAGLPAIAVYQTQNIKLEDRYRRQASSHSERV